MIKKTILTLSLLLTFTSPILAVTSTPSATPTEAQDQVTIIRNIVQQNLATAEAMIRKSSLVGYIGRISAISSTSITLKFNGDTFQVRTSEDTTYNKSGKANFSSLAIQDKATVIGTMTNKDIIDAKRIVIIKDVPSELPQVVSGKILSADTKTRIIIIRTLSGDQTFILSRRAVLKIDKFVSGKPVVAIFEMQGEDQVITTAKVF